MDQRDQMRRPTGPRRTSSAECDGAEQLTLLLVDLTSELAGTTDAIDTLNRALTAWQTELTGLAAALAALQTALDGLEAGRQRGQTYDRRVQQALAVERRSGKDRRRRIAVV
jgi:hypothetical protein